MSIEENKTSEAWWQLEERYQEKVNKCLVQGDEIRRLLEQNQRLVEALETFTRDSNWDYDEYGLPRWNGAADTHPKTIAEEAIEAYKLLEKKEG